MLSKVICYKFGKECYRQNFNLYKEAFIEAVNKNRFENVSCIVLVYDKAKGKWQKQSSLYAKESF